MKTFLDTMNARCFLSPMLCVFAACASFAPAIGSSTTLLAIDPAALTVLNRMQAAYSAMHSLSEEIVAAESPTLPHRLVVHTILKLQRPGCVSMVSDSKSSRSGSSNVVTDGSYCYVTAPEYPARYLKFPVPASDDAMETAASEGILSAFTIDLFDDPAAVNTLFSPKTMATLRLEKPVEIDGFKTQIVVMSDVNGVTMTLYIDRKDSLLRKVVVIDPNKPGDFTESYSSIQVNAVLNAADFAFSPPPHTAPFYASSFNQAVQDSTNGQ